jgi:hypothetical protein
MTRAWLVVVLLGVTSAARAQQQVPPGATRPDPERPRPDDGEERDEDEEAELGPLVMSAGVGYAAFVFNQANSDSDPSTAVATPGLAFHFEAGPRLSPKSHWGVVLAANFSAATADVLSHYTAGAAMLALGARYDESRGLRATLGLGAGGMLLRRTNGDQKTLAFAPFLHVDYPPPLFPPWLVLQGTFSYLPLPAPLRAFVAGVGVGVVR